MTWRQAAGLAGFIGWRGRAGSALAIVAGLGCLRFFMWLWEDPGLAAVPVMVVAYLVFALTVNFRLRRFQTMPFAMLLPFSRPTLVRFLWAFDLATPLAAAIGLLGLFSPAPSVLTIGLVSLALLAGIVVAGGLIEINAREQRTSLTRAAAVTGFSVYQRAPFWRRGSMGLLRLFLFSQPIALLALLGLVILLVHSWITGYFGASFMPAYIPAFFAVAVADFLSEKAAALSVWPLSRLRLVIGLGAALLLVVAAEPAVEMLHSALQSGEAIAREGPGKACAFVGRDHSRACFDDWTQRFSRARRGLVPDPVSMQRLRKSATVGALWVGILNLLVTASTVLSGFALGRRFSLPGLSFTAGLLLGALVPLAAHELVAVTGLTAALFVVGGTAAAALSLAAFVAMMRKPEA